MPPESAHFHPPLRCEKILVTGPAGRVAFPVVSRLTLDNEVWGIARFGVPGERERVEAAGIRTRAIDLGAPQWGDLPTDFTLILHFAAAIGTQLSFADAIRENPPTITPHDAAQVVSGAVPGRRRAGEQ